MAKTGWERFADYSDDGYYSDPLTLREDVDSGAAVHIARSREREAVIAYIQAVASSDAFRDLATEEERTTLRWVAEDIKNGKHHGH